MRGAKNAKPPIDSETQIPSLEVTCVIFTAAQANRSSFVVVLMSKKTLTGVSTCQKLLYCQIFQEDSLKKEMQSLRRKTDLREACMSRVPLEPTECFVTVKVRHVTMGKQERTEA